MNRKWSFQLTKMTFMLPSVTPISSTATQKCMFSPINHQVNNLSWASIKTSIIRFNLAYELLFIIITLYRCIACGVMAMFSMNQNKKIPIHIRQGAITSLSHNKHFLEEWICVFNIPDWNQLPTFFTCFAVSVSHDIFFTILSQCPRPVKQWALFQWDRLADDHMSDNHRLEPATKKL